MTAKGLPAYEIIISGDYAGDSLLNCMRLRLVEIALLNSEKGGYHQGIFSTDLLRLCKVDLNKFNGFIRNQGLPLIGNLRTFRPPTNADPV